MEQIKYKYNVENKYLIELYNSCNENQTKESLERFIEAFKSGNISDVGKCFERIDSKSKHLLCYRCFKDKILDNSDFSILLVSTFCVADGKNQMAGSLGYEKVKEMFDSIDRPFLSYNLSKNDFEQLEETLTIYRGSSNCEFLLAKKGFAWSLNKMKAMRFTTDYKINKQRILITGQVPKSEIYAYINSMYEEEIIVDPEKVKIINEEKLKDFDNLY